MSTEVGQCKVKSPCFENVFLLESTCEPPRASGLCGYKLCTYMNSEGTASQRLRCYASQCLAGHYYSVKK